MLAAVGVTFHAILEIGDAFLTMLTGNIRFVMLMASITGVGCVCARMTGCTGDGPLLAVIQREGMLAIERRGRPRVGAVAGSAVGAELPCVLDRFRVAGNTGGSCALEDTIDMALLALHVRVRARQREVGAVVVEGSAVPIRGGMAYSAVRAELTVMFIILFMAGITISGSALEHVIDVALIAFHFGMSALQLEG